MALAVVDGREIREIPLDAGRELVRLVVTDDTEARLPPRPLPATARVDSKPLSKPRPLGARDQYHSDREQGDVQPAHLASLAKAVDPDLTRRERFHLAAQVCEVRLRVERAADRTFEQLGRRQHATPAVNVVSQPLP